MNLGRTLAHLYPEAEPGVDYTVRAEEGGEPYISEWSLREPEPTREEMEAAALEAAKVSKRSELKRAFRDHYEPAFKAGLLEADYILDRLRRGLAVPQAERDKLTAVAAGIDKLRLLLARVSAAATVEEVEPVQWMP